MNGEWTRRLAFAGGVNDVMSEDLDPVALAVAMICFDTSEDDRQPSGDRGAEDGRKRRDER